MLHRHQVSFRHNSVTGSRKIVVDGATVYSVSAMYALTGAMTFEVEKHSCVIAIQSVDSVLMYSMSVNKKLVPPMHEARDSMCRWRLEGKSEDGTYASHDVKFDTDTLTVYVDGIVTEACGEFADVGSAFSVKVPHIAEEVRLQVLPAPSTKKPPIVKLTVADHEVLPISVAATSRK